MSDDIAPFGGENQSGRPERALWRSIGRGMRLRCPACGKGRLFTGYLRTVDQCDQCGEDIHHHRADDLPAYLVVFVVGHLVVGAFMGVEQMVDWSVGLQIVVWSFVTIISILISLPFAKGAVVGLQWALYMHGFSGEDDELETDKNEWGNAGER